MLLETNFEQLKLFKKGKVRDVYDLGDKLLIVATDRISCFDFVLPTAIPDKGKILTKISLFWFSFLRYTVANHLVSVNLQDLPKELQGSKDILAGRFMIVKKCEVIPFECVVRGYLSGSGWKEYQASQRVCGLELPEGLTQTDKLAKPLFTPATKAEIGHDENVDFNYMANAIGRKLADKVRDVSLKLYDRAYSYAKSKGLILADTKFEFGLHKNELILVDEVLTPDSSRFWDRDSLKNKEVPVNFDKQFVRDYLETSGWNKNPPVPDLPETVVSKTKDKYEQVLKMLTGGGNY
jgi:phosphoribosylaminoimidazole-succinocarboxamide synthase